MPQPAAWTDETRGAAAVKGWRWPASRAWLAPYIVVPAVEVALALVYWARDPLWRHPQAGAVLGFLGSLLLSAVGSGAACYLLMRAAAWPRRRWSQTIAAALMAAAFVALHVLQLGYWRVFGVVFTPCVVDFVRQHPGYSLSMLRQALTPPAIALLGALWIGMTAYLDWGIGRMRGSTSARRWSVAAGLAVFASYYAPQPYLTLDQYCVRVCGASLFGGGAVNVAFVPDRLALPPLNTTDPPSIVFFRLESIAREAVPMYGSQLDTMPHWRTQAENDPESFFQARRHFTNSSCTDVAVLLIYSGAAADDPLETHRRVPLLWDYSQAAGFYTAGYFPFQLSWGDFATRFQDRPGILRFDRLYHADNSGRPLVYDMAVADDELVDAAIENQRRRDWREPFLEIVELRMPHYLGEVARLSGVQYFQRDDLPPALRSLAHYYDAIRHNDELMKRYLDAMPADIRANTVICVLSDHGDDLYGRMARVDNYFPETAAVPFWLVIPPQVRERLGAARVAALRKNLAEIATGNEDVVPTLLDLMGLAERPAVMNALVGLRGHSLLREAPPPETMLMLNTNALRHWDREGFALLLDNARWHYAFFEGQEYLFDLSADPRGWNNLAHEADTAPIRNRVRRHVLASPELLRIATRYGMTFSTKSPAAP